MRSDPRSAKRFEPQALRRTDLSRDPTRIVTWFVQRWQVEVTFQEARIRLGVETSVSGPKTPSLVRPPACSPCSPLSPYSPPASQHARGGRSQRQHGTPNRTPPFRMPLRRPSDDLVRRGFFDLTPQTRPQETSVTPATSLGLRPLPSSLIGQSRAESVQPPIFAYSEYSPTTTIITSVATVAY